MSHAGMKFEVFHNVAIRYARTVGKNDKIKLTFGGKEASAGPRHMNLPGFEAGTVMTPWQFKVYNGYLDHETAHLRYTDWVDLQAGIKKGEFVLHSIWNVLEDVWIENLQIENYPGSKQYLDALCSYVDEEGKDHPITCQGDQFFRLFYKEAWKYRGIDVSSTEGWLSDYEEYKPIVKLMERIPKIQSTWENVTLAKEILAAVPKNVNWNAPVPGAEEGQKPFLFLFLGAGGLQLDSSIDLSKYAVIFIEAHERKGFLERLEKEIKEGNNKLIGLRDEVKSRLQEPLPSPSAAWTGKSAFPPADTSLDKIFVPALQDRPTYDKTRAAVSAEILATKKMLQIYLVAKTHRAWSRGLEEGELDEEELFSIPMGNQNVYKEKRERRLVNTALELLTDNSGSMNSELLRQAAIIMAESMAGIGNLKLSITGFTTNGKHPLNRSRSGTGRMEGMDLLVFKDYDTPYHKAKGRLGAIRGQLGTPLGDAYGYALERILARKEPRRILWVLSDGDPAYDRGDEDHNDFVLMKRIKEKAKNLGIETIGLGVSQSSRDLKLRHYVEKYAKISRFEELPETLMKILKEVTL